MSKKRKTETKDIIGDVQPGTWIVTTVEHEGTCKRVFCNSFTDPEKAKEVAITILWDHFVDHIVDEEDGETRIEKMRDELKDKTQEQRFKHLNDECEDYIYVTIRTLTSGLNKQEQERVDKFFADLDKGANPSSSVGVGFTIEI